MQYDNPSKSRGRRRDRCIEKEGLNVKDETEKGKIDEEVKKKEEEEEEMQRSKLKKMGKY